MARTTPDHPSWAPRPPAPGLPFAGSTAALQALRRSMVQDPYGAGGLPRAAPSAQPTALLGLRNALRRAVAGDYRAAPGAWPGALDEAVVALGWLGPLRGALLRALHPGAGPGAAAAFANDRPLGPLTLIAPRPGLRPLLVAAPDAFPPAEAVAAAAAVVAPAGTTAFGPVPHVAYELSPESAVEQGDRDFAMADAWSMALFEAMPADAAYREPVRLMLKHTAARRILIAGEILGAAIRSDRHARILLVAGKDDWRPLAHDLLGAGLGAEGFEVMIMTRSLDSRLAFVRHAAVLASASPPATPRPRADAQGGRRAGPLRMTPAAMAAQTLVVGDLRDPAEPRRAPTLRAMLRALAAQGRPAALLEPWSGRSPAASVTARLRRMGLGGIAAAPFLRRDLPDREASAGALAALDAFAERLPEAPGAGGFLLEATRKLLSEWPAARIAGAQIEAWARAAPGRHCFLVPAGARFEALVCAEACRRGGALSIDVQTMLSSASPRYDPPTADLVACIDTEQRDLIASNFGLPPERLPIVGVHEIDVLRDAPHPAATAAPRVVLYPTQGLPRLDAAVIRLLRAADLPALGLELLVSPHLSMGARQMAALEAAAGGALPWVHGDCLPRALAPDVFAIVTLYSNVAYRAAVLGRPVVVLRVMGLDYPVRLDRLGLAWLAEDTAGLRAALDSIRAGATPPAGNAYRSRNPQLASGSTVARILALGAATQ